MHRTGRGPRSARVIAAVLAVVALPLAGVPGAAPALAAAASGRSPLAGARPSWATTSADAGAVPANRTQNLRVYLAGADPAGLAAYATAVSSPGNADYQHYLTPRQYQTRFGPTAAQTSAVESWLVGAGLRITSANWHYIAVSGSGSAVQAAFGTTLRSYRTATGVQQAPASAVSVPTALAPAVLTVSGLTTSAAEPTSDMQFDALPGSAPINVGTCSEYDGQKAADELPRAYGSTLAWDLCGYEPAQLRSAYGVAGSGLTGRGTTVAIVDDGSAPTLEQDLNTYSQTNGLPRLRPGQFAQNLPSDITASCPAQPAYEASLDVEAVHTTAPGANLLYVGADCASANDDLDAELRIVDGHLADIVSDSWHFGIEQQLPPDLITAFDRVMEQGAVEGIGFYFASGDNGDWSSATPDHAPAVQYPGSDPWVTSVGGTSLAIDQQGRYEWETGWGTMFTPLSADGSSWAGLPGTFAGGSGGGVSTLFEQPAYQHNVVPKGLSAPNGTGVPMRVIPDIAVDADPSTGMLIGLTVTLAAGAPAQYVEGRAGGTSLATPLIAGIQADAQQAEGGTPLGFADPAIYERYDSPAFRDVTDDPLGPNVPIAMADEARDPGTGATTISADTFGLDQSLAATRGYDDVTGVGTPTGYYLDSYRGR